MIKKPRFKKKIINLIAVLFLLFSNALLFLSGSFLERSKIENVSYTLSSIAEKSKTGNAFVTLVKKEPGFNSYNDILSYCVNYCNVFYNSSPFQYYPTYNGMKDKNFSITELSTINQSPTLLLCGAFSSHKSNDGKHNIFDACYLKVYNEKTDTKIDDGATNFVLISDKQARYLRDNVWHLSYSDDNNFDFAIGKQINANLNGTIAKWKIGNVYYADGSFAEIANSFYEEFIIAYYYGLPNKGDIKLEIGCSFQSGRFICYNKLLDAFNNFGVNDYRYCVNKMPNIDSKLVDQLNNDLNNQYTTDSIFYFIFFLSFLLYVFFAVIMFFMFNDCLNLIILSAIVFATSWLLFKLVSLLSRSSLLFSYFSLVIYAIYFVVFIALLIVFWRKKIGENNQQL